ncbi:MAG: N-acetyl-gamma-glutamyl-phosphate reductase [Candidatus Sumerlaeaceae bacterium]
MSTTPQIRAGIIGAAGLSAGRLLRILAQHPNVSIHAAISESSPGKPIATAHPELRGLVDRNFDALDFDMLGNCDVVFSCKKAGETFPFVQQLLDAGARLIDLSGDYRLEDEEAYQRWYGLPHQHPTLLKKQHAVYGLPEYYRDEIRGARLVANPGCYTTTSILACAPLVAAGYGHEDPIIIDAISGVSGAGRNPKAENQFLSVADNVRAYRVGSHQHTPEIEQELTAAARKVGDKRDHPGIQVLFVPHVGPYKIGILADCYLRVRDHGRVPTSEDVYEILSNCYKDEPFVRVYEPGTLPQIEYVTGTNFCDIGATADQRTGTIVLVSATDNLLKGAAGQAVQNMNIMFGFAETTGLL